MIRKVFIDLRKNYVDNGDCFLCLSNKKGDRLSMVLIILIELKEIKNKLYF